MPTEQRTLSVSTAATIGGCCGLFDLCSDQDLLSLSFAGREPFLDWIGWEASDVCKIIKNFITFTRPEYSQGSPTAGYQADPCGDANSVEWGTCDFQLEDFGRLRRKTPVRDITKSGLRLCETQPRYRLDGTPITDDLEFDLRIVTEVNLQDLKRMVINGNDATPGQFNGLDVLVDDGYVNTHGRRCSSMDSIVIDWNANDFDGGAGITWNGAAVGATYNLIDVLLAVYRRIRQRLAMADALNSPLTPGDMVFVAPTYINQCLLNAFTCWSVCPGAALDQAFLLQTLNTFEARTFRDRLNGGMFGAGAITLDGFTIPLLNYDWVLPTGPTLADAFLLTGRVGGQRLIQGQYNDMRVAAGKRPGWFDYTDGGRVLTWIDSDGTCDQRFVEMQPRLLVWAPWAQARFVDLKCATPGGFISPDPTETSFFIESSFSVASCP